MHLLFYVENWDHGNERSIARKGRCEEHESQDERKGIGLVYRVLLTASDFNEFFRGRIRLTFN